MNTTLPEHCSSNILLIPESLFDMADATAIMAHGTAGIFHKLIRQDMRDIEFFTNAPCLACVLRGRETFYSPEDEELVLHEGDMLFMPRELHMISDFTNAEGPLEALLFFFDGAVVQDFFRRLPPTRDNSGQAHRPYKLPASEPISHYLAGIASAYQGFSGNRHLLHTKLMELLFLIEATDDSNRLRSFLMASSDSGHKRNIRHLMRNYGRHDLSVGDFATLSGRSLSSFNRDFKRQFGVTPIQWLVEAKLERAHALVLETDLSIAEIAFDVGYSNTSHFIKAFKAKYAITPKQARMALA